MLLLYVTAFLTLFPVAVEGRRLWKHESFRWFCLFLVLFALATFRILLEGTPNDH